MRLDFLPLERPMTMAATASLPASSMAWAEGYWTRRRSIDFVKTPAMVSSSGKVTERIRFMSFFKDVIWSAILSFLRDRSFRLGKAGRLCLRRYDLFPEKQELGDYKGVLLVGLRFSQ